MEVMQNPGDPLGGRELGWRVAAIEPDRVQTRFHDEHGAPAWLATIKRI